MILIQVALYSPLRKNYIPQEAIIDTGANICAIAEHVAKRFGLSIADETIHLWQVRDPLVLRKTKLNLLHNEQKKFVEAVVVDIPENLRRTALSEYTKMITRTFPIMGMLDELRLYDRALSEAEVLQNYESEGLAVNPAGKLSFTWGGIKR